MSGSSARRAFGWPTALGLGAAFCLWLAVLFSATTYYACVAGVAVACIAWGFRQLRKARLLEDVPTSTIRAAAQGYVELHGVAAATPLTSPLSGAPCCWWSLGVWSRNPDKKWKVLPDRIEFSSDLIRLVDDTGECLVDPAGAEVAGTHRAERYGLTADPSQATASPRKGQYRFVEEWLPAGAALTAIGSFAGLPRDFPAQAAGAATDLLARPADGRRFLVSAMAQDQAVAHYRGGATFAFKYGLALACIALLVEQGWHFWARQEPCPDPGPVTADCLLGHLYHEMAEPPEAAAARLSPSEQEDLERALADAQAERADP